MIDLIWSLNETLWTLIWLFRIFALAFQTTTLPILTTNQQFSDLILVILDSNLAKLDPNRVLIIIHNGVFCRLLEAVYKQNEPMLCL